MTADEPKVLSGPPPADATGRAEQLSDATGDPSQAADDDATERTYSEADVSKIRDAEWAKARRHYQEREKQLRAELTEELTRDIVREVVDRLGANRWAQLASPTTKE